MSIRLEQQALDVVNALGISTGDLSKGRNLEKAIDFVDRQHAMQFKHGTKSCLRRWAAPDALTPAPIPQAVAA